MTFRIKPSESSTNYISAFRIVDRESGDALLWNCSVEHGVNASLYSAYNLRKFYGAGVKTFDIRIYAPQCFKFTAKPPDKVTPRCWKQLTPTSVDCGDEVLSLMEAGDYTVIDFIRAEAA